MTEMVTATNRHASLNADKAAALFEAHQAEELILVKDGEERFSSARLAERVRDVMLRKALVRNKNEVQTHAIEPADLTALVFPSVTNPTSPDWPEADDDSDDAEITRHVWK